MPAYNLTFSGRVQGVCFRDFVRTNADELRLDGWVLNDEDGTVKAFVQGEEPDIEEFIGRCWNGPKDAKVDNIEKTGSEEDPAIEGFDVRY